MNAQGGFHSRLVLLLFTLACAIDSNAQSGDSSKITYRVYGLPPDLLTQCAERIAANDMGFEFLSVGGCLVGEDVRIEVIRQNRIADSLLVLKHGRDWQKLFDLAIERERDIISPIDSLVCLTQDFTTAKDSLGVDGNLWVLISKDAEGHYVADLSTLNGTGDGIESFHQIVFTRYGLRCR